MTCLGLRPEYFLPVSEVGDPDEVTFPFVVHREEYLGSERLLYGDIGETKAVARFPVTSPIVVEFGQLQGFSVARRQLKVFDPGTGLRRGVPE